MNKFKLIGFCMLASLVIVGCDKNTKTSSSSSSSSAAQAYEHKVVEIGEYKTSCMKGTGSIFVNGSVYAESSSYIKDPVTFDGNATWRNLIKTCPISGLTDKMVVYTPDWWLRTTSEREDDLVFEYLVQKDENDEYVVKEVYQGTGNVVPLDGVIISVPASYSGLIKGQKIEFTSDFTIRTYETAVYTEKGRRIPVSSINPTYMGLNSATMFDNGSDTKLVHGEKRLNTIVFNYDKDSGAFISSNFDQRDYDNNLQIPLDGFILTNEVRTTNKSSLLLEKDVIFEDGGKAYIENVPGIFDKRVVYKRGFQGTKEVDGVNKNVGPNVEVITTNKVNNEWGYEIAVVDGKVKEHAVNVEHPSNGYRIRFTAFDDTIEANIKGLRELFKIGTSVSYNSDAVIVTHNLPNIASTYLKSLEDEMDDYIKKQEVELYDFDVAKAKELKSQFNDNKNVIAQLNVDDNNTTKQYYYLNRVHYAKYLQEQAFLHSSTSEPVETRSTWHYPLSAQETVDTIKKTIKQLKDANFNEVIVSGSIDETTNYGVAYTSKYAATAPSLSGKFGKYKDYLDAFVSIAHENGLKVQVGMSNWFFYRAIIDREPSFANYYALNFDGTTGEHGAGEITKFLDPANKNVRSLYLNMYREIIDNYNIDGFHLDYIRYGAHNDTLDGNSQGYTEAALAGFKVAYPQYNYLSSLANFKTELKSNSIMFSDFCDYRRSLVTSFVGEVRLLAQGKQLTIAVVSDSETARRVKMQDWKTWLANNYIDSIHLMAYYCDFGYVVKDSLAALDHANGMAFVVSGLSPIYSGLEIMELPYQIAAARSTKVQGSALFATHSFGNRPELGEYLNGKRGQGVYNQDAIVAYESVDKISNAFANKIKERITKYYKNSGSMNDSQEAALISDLDALVKAKTNMASARAKVDEMTNTAKNGGYGTGYVQARVLETLEYMQGIYKIHAYKSF